MTTREFLQHAWTSGLRACSGAGLDAEVYCQAWHALQAHLDTYGYPEEPKVCETCRHGRHVCRLLTIPVHSVAVVFCQSVHHCGAWEAKKTP